MLIELHIKNIAVIDEVRIEFQSGFNVLTGETGAGKSILIDSINLALGGRAAHDIIRTGCDFAQVDLTFEVTSKRLLGFLSDAGIFVEDNLVTLSRRIGLDGKNVYRICGGIVSSTYVREVAPMLIDIHGQNDNQALLNPKNHLAYLDEYGKLEEDLQKYRLEYFKLKEIKKEITALSESEEEKARQLDMLTFQFNEIDAANLKSGEEDELYSHRTRLLNMESIVSGAGSAYSALYGGDPSSAFDLLSQAKRALSSVCEFDSTLSESFERLEAVIAETEDIAQDINACLSGTEYSAADLDRIEERLDTISNLKRKYGDSIDKILEYSHLAKEKALAIQKSDERLLALNKELSELQAHALLLAKNLSEKRIAAAKVLEKQISDELTALDMPKVVFSVQFASKDQDDENTLCEYGKDNVQFLISTNPGETQKPMAKIASGGELSRIMLAIKSVLSEMDGAHTMIFDEIDTGVSGRAAQKIAEKISLLSKSKQIFSITHLAQIASMADNHFLIEKETQDGRTFATVKPLGEDARIRELARIIGGVTVTDLTLKSAEEMLTLAKAKKGF